MANSKEIFVYVLVLFVNFYNWTRIIYHYFEIPAAADMFTYFFSEVTCFLIIFGTKKYFVVLLYNYFRMIK
jgi:hypothetical protein